MTRLLNILVEILAHTFELTCTVLNSKMLLGDVLLKLLVCLVNFLVEFVDTFEEMLNLALFLVEYCWGQIVLHIKFK